MNTCISGQAARNSQGNQGRTCARCSASRKKAPMKAKARNTNFTRERQALSLCAVASSMVDSLCIYWMGIIELHFRVTRLAQQMDRHLHRVRARAWHWKKVAVGGTGADLHGARACVGWAQSEWRHGRHDIRAVDLTLRGLVID